MRSLLDKARETGGKPRRELEITQEHIELALAWALDEISLTQVTIALGNKRVRNPSSTYITLARALRAYLQQYRHGEK